MSSLPAIGRFELVENCKFQERAFNGSIFDKNAIYSMVDNEDDAESSLQNGLVSALCQMRSLSEITYCNHNLDLTLRVATAVAKTEDALAQAFSIVEQELASNSVSPSKGCLAGWQIRRVLDWYFSGHL